MRNKLLDAVKAISAYFVVLLHIRFPGRTGEVINVLARFAVPLFFMVSGYFCYRNDGKILEKLPGKIKRIFLLTVISYAFYIVWQCFQRSIEGEDIVSWLADIVEWEHIKEFILYNNSTPVKWHLWFLPALLYCYFLFMLVAQFRLFKIAYIFIPVLLLGHFWMEEAAVFTGEVYKTMEFRNYLYTGFPFFMLGYWIHGKKICLPGRSGEASAGKASTGKTSTGRTQFGKIRTSILWLGIVTGSILSIAEYFKYGLMELFVGTVILSVSLFVLAISRKQGCEPVSQKSNCLAKLYSILAEIGRKHAFFIYLFHLVAADMVMDLANVMGVGETVIYGWLRPVIVCILTTAAAVGISAMRKKLPVHFR
ncbi:acyltransferase [Blautia schinkii]|nr:acyltransferase [Blautia schinkii]